MIDTRREAQGLFVLADFSGVPDAAGVLTGCRGCALYAGATPSRAATRTVDA